MSLMDNKAVILHTITKIQVIWCNFNKNELEPKVQLVILLECKNRNFITVKRVIMCCKIIPQLFWAVGFVL